MSELTAKSALDRAKAEINKENEEKAVNRFKAKLREIDNTKVILANLERQLKEIEREIEHGL